MICFLPADIDRPYVLAIAAGTSAEPTSPIAECRARYGRG